MYNILNKLISAHFYTNSETASQKVDVFFACNKLTDIEYADLTALLAQVYPAPPMEVPTHESALAEPSASDAGL